MVLPLVLYLPPERFRNATRTSPKVGILKSGVVKKLTVAQKKAWVLSKLEKPRNVELALVAIFNRQTADEQATNTTSNNNARGFNGLDAEFGSSLAKTIIKYGRLSPNQSVYASKLVTKYWKQLIEVAETKGTMPGSNKVVATVTNNEVEYGCSTCGCPEFHDGEVCPSL